MEMVACYCREGKINESTSSAADWLIIKVHPGFINVESKIIDVKIKRLYVGL